MEKKILIDRISFEAKINGKWQKVSMSYEDRCIDFVDIYAEDNDTWKTFEIDGTMYHCQIYGAWTGDDENPSRNDKSFGVIISMYEMEYNPNEKHYETTYEAFNTLSNLQVRKFTVDTTDGIKKVKIHKTW